MRFVIDRIEMLPDKRGGFAVCQTKDEGDGAYHMVDISLDKLPAGVKPGDILEETDGLFSVMKNKDDGTFKNLRKRFQGLFEKK